MSRLITTTGIELPTFSPALGPESAKNKAPVLTKAPTKKPVLTQVLKKDPIQKNKVEETNVKQLMSLEFDNSFTDYYSPFNGFHFNTLLNPQLTNNFEHDMDFQNDFAYGFSYLNNSFNYQF
ncbi:unnamed protein product [Brachionus calyciflorus]|uniref:Uncharacterized protein n=1 Tax=Brachionus calyciflorus TaxID=104777 RepID=A0A813MDG0_9BILA|nr:unnamed protein product [Brachionus calyciflorus]